MSALHEGKAGERYDERLYALRREFPQPVSDAMHDAYMVFSILRALDQVDGLKSEAPILGRPLPPDYLRQARASGCLILPKPCE